MANSMIKNPNAVQTTTSDGLYWYKSGRVVYCVFDKNSITAAADAKIADIPNGFEPIKGITTLDNLNSCRIQFTGSSVKTLTAMSNTSIRGAVTYISTN